MRIALNIVVLYMAWFAAVLSAAGGRPWAAAAASVVAVIVNIALAPRRSADLKLVLAAVPIGLAVDGIMIASGLATYAAAGPITGWPPAWLVLMWMAFATMLNAGLAWLKHRLVLAALLGLVGGPLSYFAGARLGAMQFSDPVWLGLGTLGLLWAVAFPTLLYLARRADRSITPLARADKAGLARADG